jgi:hypothetical protein
MVKISTVSVTTTLVHAEDCSFSKDMVKGQMASRTQPVHWLGTKAVAFSVINDV